MSTEKITIFTTIPKLSELQYYTGLIDPDEERDDSVPTDYQWQILKTRFLIWKNPQIIASPVPFNFSRINIIAPIHFVEEGLLAECSKKHKLKLIGPFTLFKDVYQECIEYCFAFRLAPQWNKIKSFYINNSTDFLTCSEPMDSIKIESSFIEGNQFILKLNVLRVKLPLFNLLDLNINLQTLKAKGIATVQKNVFILPHLKQGTAVNVTSKIPPSSPFQKYSQIRRHWKNTHGYRLPHDEDGMLYVQVAFNNSRILYSYPVICVRTSNIHQLKCKDPMTVVNQFAQETMKKLATICEHPIQFNIVNGNVFQPIVRLHASFEPTDFANLSTIELKKHEGQTDSEVNTATQLLIKPTTSNATLNTPLKGITDMNGKETLKRKYEDPKTFFPKVVTASSPSLPISVLQKVIPIFNPTAKIMKASEMESVSLTQPNDFKMEIQKEIEGFAKAKCLERCKLNTLQIFCRSNGISIKSRDRKDILIQKIYDFFDLA